MTDAKAAREFIRLNFGGEGKWFVWTDDKTGWVESATWPATGDRQLFLAPADCYQRHTRHGTP